MKKIFIPILLLLGTSACTSKFIVRSEPSDGEVLVRKNGAQEGKVIGKTPLEISSSDLKEKFGLDYTSGELLEIIVSKPDFVSEKFQIPASRFGTMQTELFAKLKAGSNDSEKVKAVVQHLTNAQKFSALGEFERAQIELDKVFVLAPNFSKALTMQGSLYFLQKKYNESLDSFEKALQNDPQLEDATKMIAYIRQKLGKDSFNRSPASTKQNVSGGSQ